MKAERNWRHIESRTLPGISRASRPDWLILFAGQPRPTTLGQEEIASCDEIYEDRRSSLGLRDPTDRGTSDLS